MNKIPGKPFLFPFVLCLLASILLLVALKLPLWQMRLEAPQYRDEEALRVAVYPSALGGDIRELSVLDRYIGVHIPPALPQFKWLPAALVSGALLGLIATFLPGVARCRALLSVCCALTAALVLAAIQANFQMYDIGHKRDQKTVLAGVRDFSPPFLGTTKIAQFTVNSRFGLGAWLIGGALILQLGAVRLSRKTLAAGVTPTASKAFAKESVDPTSHAPGYNAKAHSPV